MSFSYWVLTLLLFGLFAGGTVFLFSRQFGLAAVTLASLTYIVVLIVLKRRPVALRLFQVITGGILLVFIWRTDQSAGLVPTAFTVPFVFSVYDAIVAFRRERKVTQHSVDPDS
jgi:hypothetical protein